MWQAGGFLCEHVIGLGICVGALNVVSIFIDSHQMQEYGIIEWSMDGMAWYIIFIYDILKWNRPRWRFSKARVYHNDTGSVGWSLMDTLICGLSEWAPMIEDGCGMGYQLILTHL